MFTSKMKNTIKLPKGHNDSVFLILKLEQVELNISTINMA